MELWTLERGSTPLIIDIPHAGTFVPSSIEVQLTAAALSLPDTDWHVEKLYAFAAARGATVMAATHSRYVVDLNRDPSGVALYPGVDNTEVCPTRTFANEPIYDDGAEPRPIERAARIDEYWRPYHAVLAQKIAAIVDRHGYAIVLDAHSIRSEVPRFFAGCLADLNLGTVDGHSAAPSLERSAMHSLSAVDDFTSVANGRFKGGYVTRHYGRPQQRVHALQLEIAQACYMDETPPYPWSRGGAAALIDVLERFVAVLLDWRPG